MHTTVKMTNKNTKQTHKQSAYASIPKLHLITSPHTNSHDSPSSEPTSSILHSTLSSPATDVRLFCKDKFLAYFISLYIAAMAFCTPFSLRIIDPMASAFCISRLLVVISFKADAKLLAVNYFKAIPQPRSSTRFA